MGENERPFKRQRTKGWGGGGGAKGKANDKSKYRAQASRGHLNISASGLNSGDVGIFVTSDKGKEKACLREMEDLLSEELGLDSEVEPDEESSTRANDELGTLLDGEADGESTGNSIQPAKEESGGIEDDIQKELAELAGAGVTGTKRKHLATGSQNGAATAEFSKRRLGLVTLDIPCVSFVRFPPHVTRDPVEVATKLCKDARAHPERQRSRFVKRLTPLSKVRKVMNSGIEELCQDVLPPAFGGEEGLKYAVRVTAMTAIRKALSNQARSSCVVFTASVGGSEVAGAIVIADRRGENDGASNV